MIFLLLINLASADWYIVPEVGSGRPVIVGRTPDQPPDTIAPAPLDPSGQPYPIEAIDIVEEPIDTITGVTRKVAKINPGRLQAWLRDEAKRKEDQGKQDLAFRSKFERLRAQCARETGATKELCEIVTGLPAVADSAGTRSWWNFFSR